MNWLNRLNEIEQHKMVSIPTVGAITHAIKKDSAETWEKMNNASAKAEQNANELIVSLKKEADSSTHSLIESVLQNILTARNKKIQECLDILQGCDSTEAIKLLNSLKTKIVKAPDISSSELPEEMLAKVSSANANGFNPFVYEALLPYARLMHTTEMVGVPEEHAYKLAKIFTDRYEAIQYLLNYQKNHPNRPQVMHDACLFVFSAENCTADTWQQLAKKHMDNEEFVNLLSNAGAIEKLINDDFNKNKPDTAKIKTLAEEISQLKTEWKALGKKKSQLTTMQNDRYEELTRLISSKRVELSYAYAGTSFSKNCPVEMLRAYYERYKATANTTHAEFIACGMTSKDYEKFVKLKRVDDEKRFPPIILDGNEFGYPGLYAMKVPVLEEKWASKMARMGKETGCCQSLSGEAGEPCAIHLLTSPEGAGFLVAEGDVHNPKPEDTLYAGAWAWRSKKDHVVFDSIEGNRSILSRVQDASIHFMRRLGYEYVKRGYTDKFVCGASSGLSFKVGVKDFFDNSLEEFIDYNGYTDAKNQLTIYDKGRPYYLYGQEEFANTETQSLLDEILNDKKPLNSSQAFIEMLNWAIVNNGDVLLDKIKQSAGDRENEVNACINCVDALNRGDLDTFLEYVKPGPLFHIRNRYGKNPVILAAEKGCAKVLSSLLEGGEFNINEQDSAGNSLLSKAIKSGSVETVNILVSAGADLNQKDQSGNTILFSAIESDLSELVQMFIDEGVDINHKDKNNTPAVSFAAFRGYTKSMQVLIKAGAEHDLNHLLKTAVSNSKIDTAQALIHMGASISESLVEDAAWGSSAEMFAFLRKAGGLYDKDKALSLAALLRRPETVKLLLDEGANPNVRDEHGGVPLCDAVQHDDTKTLELLIHAKADLNIRHNRGYGLSYTALIEATAKHNLDAFRLLLKAGADVNMPNRVGWTPLHCTFTSPAFFSNRIEFAQELIAAGANLNAQDNEGNTPLHNAVKDRDVEGVKLLIKNGANTSVQNNKGLTPLEFALALIISENAERFPGSIKEYQEIASLLQKAQDASQKTQATQSAFFQIPRLRLVKINQLMKYDDFEGLIQLLHETHSVIDTWIKDEDGNYCTLLMHACEMGALKTVKALIKAGADPKKTDPDGDTSAAYAVDSNTNSTEILDVLSKEGVDFTSPNFENETVLDRAKESNNEVIVRYLSDKFEGPTPV